MLLLLFLRRLGGLSALQHRIHLLLEIVIFLILTLSALTRRAISPSINRASRFSAPCTRACHARDIAVLPLALLSPHSIDD